MQVIAYLGYPLGVGPSPVAKLEFILEKNCLLTMFLDLNSQVKSQCVDVKLPVKIKIVYSHGSWNLGGHLYVKSIPYEVKGF